MTNSITVQPSGVKYRSEGNLLDDALSQSIPLEYSCKTGDCGVCKAEVITGKAENEIGEVVTSGNILICQSKAKSDLTIHANYIPELASIVIKTVPCKVDTIEYPTNDILVIKLRLPPSTTLDYLPGQYIDLIYKGVKRSYSIANAKNNSNQIELHIRKVEGGKMSGLLFGKLRENSLMRLEGPKGTFFVREEPKPLILIATGTGIAPIKSIVEDLINNHKERQIYIYWGMQFLREIYCKELISLVSSHDNIQLKSVLSRENNANLGSSFSSGYVQNIVIDDFDTLDGKVVYACGSPTMIKEAKELFLKHQLSVDDFYSDAFTAAK